MADRVLLHIGAPKTATTYLQGTLRANRDLLASRGVLWPAEHVDHFRMALAVTGRAGELPRPGEAQAAWRRLTEAAAQWPGTVVLSNEMFAPASAEQAAEALESLRPADVHVVYTLRDLARMIPSAWQQSLRRGGTLGLDDFVSAIRKGTPDATWFEALHGVEGVLQRWGAGLDPQQVHVVTVPSDESQRARVWLRFASVIGVDPTGCRERAEPSNTSLDPIAAELLRRVNLQLFDAVDDQRQLARWVRRNVVNGGVLDRSLPGRRIRLRPEDHAWAVQRAERSAAYLRQSGYDVVGDLEETVPGPEAPTGVHPDDPDLGDLADAATKALAAVLSRWWADDLARRQPKPEPEPEPEPT